MNKKKLSILAVLGSFVISCAFITNKAKDSFSTRIKASNGVDGSIVFSGKATK